METCFALMPLRIEAVDSFLEESRNFLRRSFSFSQHKNESLEVTIAKARDRLLDLTTTSRPEIASPYEWLRLSGTIVLGECKHDVDVFAYPISDDEAAASVCFSDSIYDLVSGSEAGFDEAINQEAKESLVALLSGVVEVSECDAFAYGMVRSDEDMTPSIDTDSLRHWLEGPDRELISQKPYFLVGVRKAQVNRSLAERHWPAERLNESQAGFLLFDGIGSIGLDD